MIKSNPFLSDQLIPYIGNKRKLLSLINSAIKKTGVTSGTFLDLFSGSGVVSRLAKVDGFKVVSNDWEPYSQIINNAYILQNQPPEFANLGGIDKTFKILNELPNVKGYISNHYCPSDDDDPDVATERMFYTQRNGRRIDAIREQIYNWSQNGVITKNEEDVLLASLIYQSSYCSNTSGVFKGFHNGWGGSTNTALYRIKSHLAIRPPLFWNNNQENLVFREDANIIAENIKCDIAYLDPPYNQHQYGSNYHLLNTVALWDKPPINPLISTDIKDKAAIRKDWRTKRKSLYCYKASALKAFCELIEKINANYILVSYSTEGLIPFEDMFENLSKFGKLDVIVRKYKRYRVSSQRPSPKQHTVEFVTIVNAKKKSTSIDIEKAINEVLENELYKASS